MEHFARPSRPALGQSRRSREHDTDEECTGRAFIADCESIPPISLSIASVACGNGQSNGDERFLEEFHGIEHMDIRRSQRMRLTWR
jgi:hypothetical protein